MDKAMEFTESTWKQSGPDIRFTGIINKYKVGNGLDHPEG